MSCQHSKLCSCTLLKEPGKTVWMGRIEITDEQRRAILVGSVRSSVWGEEGRTDCRDVSGFLTPEGYTSRSTALNQGRTGEALLWLC